MNCIAYTICYCIIGCCFQSILTLFIYWPCCTICIFVLPVIIGCFWIFVIPHCFFKMVYIIILILTNHCTVLVFSQYFFKFCKCGITVNILYFCLNTGAKVIPWIYYLLFSCWTPSTFIYCEINILFYFIIICYWTTLIIKCPIIKFICISFFLSCCIRYYEYWFYDKH